MRKVFTHPKDPSKSSRKKAKTPDPLILMKKCFHHQQYTSVVYNDEESFLKCFFSKISLIESQTMLNKWRSLFFGNKHDVGICAKLSFAKDQAKRWCQLPITYAYLVAQSCCWKEVTVSCYSCYSPAITKAQPTEVVWTNFFFQKKVYLNLIFK